MSNALNSLSIWDLIDHAEAGTLPDQGVILTRDLFVDIYGLLDEMSFEIEEYGFISEGLANQVRSVQADVKAIVEREGL